MGTSEGRSDQQGFWSYVSDKVLAGRFSGMFMSPEWQRKYHALEQGAQERLNYLTALMAPTEKDTVPQECADDFKSDRYILGDKRNVLGKGTWGVVYLAFDKQESKNVALKFFSNSQRAQLLLKERGLTEADIMRKECEGLDLKGVANIAPRRLEYYKSTQTGKDRPFVVMNVYASSLQDYLEEAGAPKYLGKGLEERTLLSYSIDTARGLNELHTIGKKGHYDIKPANLLVSESAEDKGKVFIADLGVASLVGLDEEKSRPNANIGTKQTRAPENTVEGAQHHIVSDYWSYGALLYRMITGKNILEDFYKNPGKYGSELEKSVLEYLRENPQIKIKDISTENVPPLGALVAPSRDEKETLPPGGFAGSKDKPKGYIATHKLDPTRKMRQPLDTFINESDTQQPPTTDGERNLRKAKYLGASGSSGPKPDQYLLPERDQQSAKKGVPYKEPMLFSPAYALEEETWRKSAAASQLAAIRANILSNHGEKIVWKMMQRVADKKIKEAPRKYRSILYDCLRVDPNERKERCKSMDDIGKRLEKIQRDIATYKTAFRVAGIVGAAALSAVSIGYIYAGTRAMQASAETQSELAHIREVSTGSMGLPHDQTYTSPPTDSMKAVIDRCRIHPDRNMMMQRMLRTYAMAAERVKRWEPLFEDVTDAQRLAYAKSQELPGYYLLELARMGHANPDESELTLRRRLQAEVGDIAPLNLSIQTSLDNMTTRTTLEDILVRARLGQIVLNMAQNRSGSSEYRTYRIATDDKGKRLISEREQRFIDEWRRLLLENRDGLNEIR